MNLYSKPKKAMESILTIKSKGIVMRIVSRNGCVLASSLRSAFLIPHYTQICLLQEVKEDQVALEFNGEYFTLLSGWTTTTNFELKYDEEFALHTNFAAVVEMCKQFIMFSRIDGEMHEGNILNCVTIATKEYALMAGHCLPKNITEGTQFNIYSSTNTAYSVKLIFIDQETVDFAILKIINGEFPTYPMRRKYPNVGSRYFVLGIDGDYPNSASLSVFRGSFRNCDVTVDGSVVIGCPGTTSGCSGGGVFSEQGELQGVVTGGRLSTVEMQCNAMQLDFFEHIQLIVRKLGEPSFCHIIPTVYIFNHLPKLERKKIA